METEATQPELIMMAVMVGGTALCGVGLIVLTVPIWFRGLVSMTREMSGQYKEIWKEFLSKEEDDA